MNRLKTYKFVVDLWDIRNDIASMRYTPAAWCIKIFGGVVKLATALGKSPSSVSRWTSPKDQKGLDGRVPSIDQRRILRLAREKDLDVNAEDLIEGRFMAEEPAFS